MSDIVGVASQVDLTQLKMHGVLADPPLILGPRATKAAIEPLLITDDIRVFVFPVNRALREEAFVRIFKRYEMRFDSNLIEEVWNIPSKIGRLVECRSIIVVDCENSTLYSTRNPFAVKR